MIYACSDIHGHYDQYVAMLSQLSLRPDDTLYILGDVIDRGPDGVKILQDMMARPNVVPILGNHEFTAALCLPWLMEEITDQSLAQLSATRLATLQEWLINGGEPTLRALRELTEEGRQEILDYCTTIRAPIYQNPSPLPVCQPSRRRRRYTLSSMPA